MSSDRRSASSRTARAARAAMARSPRRLLGVLLLVLLAGLSVPAASLAADRSAADRSAADRSAADRSAADIEPTVGGDECRRLFPRGHLYSPYLADPGRAGYALAVASFVDSDTEEAGDTRFVVRLGGVYGLVRGACDAPSPWQVDFSAGFLGHFDIDSQLDSIAWDGFYSLMFTRGHADGWAFRVGLLHDSAHLGDEFIEETGRQRTEFTREEVIVGVSWGAPRHWRLYGEVGHTYNSRDNEALEPLRVQAGAEWVGEPRPRRQTIRPYAALDVEALETRDLEPRATLQSGLMLVRDGGDDLYRFGVELTTGPSTLGELVFEDETSIAVGMWFDI